MPFQGLTLGLGSGAQVLLGGGLEEVQACPGEALDECFVDVGQAGVGEVVAQVIQVGPGTVSAHQLAGGLGVSQGFVPAAIHSRCSSHW
jgi:hypothetical protein